MSPPVAQSGGGSDARKPVGAPSPAAGAKAGAQPGTTFRRKPWATKDANPCTEAMSLPAAQSD
eukprot:1008153-Alexandrium_andersonii.AAC.1